VRVSAEPMPGILSSFLKKSILVSKVNLRNAPFSAPTGCPVAALCKEYFAF